MKWNFTYYYNWNLKAKDMNIKALRLIRCAFWLILLLLLMILVLLLLPSTVGPTFNILNIIGVANVKINLGLLDLIGLNKIVLM